MKCAARDQRPAFPFSARVDQIALIGEFKRARSGGRGVDALWRSESFRRASSRSCSVR
jgi:hypothetical protein